MDNFAPPCVTVDVVASDGARRRLDLDGFAFTASTPASPIRKVRCRSTLLQKAKGCVALISTGKSACRTSPTAALASLAKKRGPLSSESGPLREQSSATSPNVIHAALTEIPTPANLASAILLASTRTSMAKTQRRQQVYSSSSSACSISSVISMV